jgi:two-component system, response regulator PdtaR
MSSGAPRRRALIVEDETLVGMGLRAQLEKLGYEVVGQAADAAEARQLYRQRRPDVVLMDIRLKGADGIALAAELLADRPCPMVVLSAYGDKELVDRACAAGVFGYLLKPATIESLQAQIEVAVQRFGQQQSLLKEKEALAQTLETRKLVERAKGIFMKRMSLDEAEAHRRLQQESQKRRLSIADLARRVIESEELLGS